MIVHSKGGEDMNRLAISLAEILAVLAAMAPTARGEYIMNVNQVGTDVVATGRAL
jgi:hypothetical protein